MQTVPRMGSQERSTLQSPSNDNIGMHQPKAYHANLHSNSNSKYKYKGVNVSQDTMTHFGTGEKIITPMSKDLNNTRKMGSKQRHD